MIFRPRLERSGGADDDLDERGVKVGGVGQLDSNRENMALMTEALRDREEHIEQLQEKVKQASRGEHHRFPTNIHLRLRNPTPTTALK